MHEQAKQRREAARAREAFRRLLAEGRSPADAYRELQRLHPRGAPSRSTAYEWAGQWREERDADHSGVWTLESDRTGRPDLVMRVIAALRWHLYARAEKAPPRQAFREFAPATVTHDEAAWVVRLAVALPEIIAPRVAPEDGDGQQEAHPLLELLQLAQMRIGATQRGADTLDQAELDAAMAGYFTEDRRYRDAR